jgi:hypothetical protein
MSAPKPQSKSRKPKLPSRSRSASRPDSRPFWSEEAIRYFRESKHNDMSAPKPQSKSRKPKLPSRSRKLVPYSLAWLKNHHIYTDIIPRGVGFEGVPKSRLSRDKLLELMTIYDLPPAPYSLAWLKSQELYENLPTEEKYPEFGNKTKSGLSRIELMDVFLSNGFVGR